MIAILRDILYVLSAAWKRWRNPPRPRTLEEEADIEYRRHIQPAQIQFLIALYRWHTGIHAPPLVPFGVRGPDGGEPEEWSFGPILPLSPALSAACRKYGFYRLGESVMQAFLHLVANTPASASQQPGDLSAAHPGGAVNIGPVILLRSFYDAIQVAAAETAKDAHDQHRRNLASINRNPDNAISIAASLATYDCGPYAVSTTMPPLQPYIHYKK